MHRKVKPADFFLIRSPRLPLSLFDKINSQNSEKDFWHFVVLLLKDPQILDAIAIASQDLYDQLIPILNEPFKEETRQLLPAIYKYISRMSIRPTPFGKFSSISVGNISNDKTKLVLSSRFHSKYRLDYSSQEIINQKLLRNSKTLENVVFYPNTTLIDHGDSFSYIEYVEQSSDRGFNWARVNSNMLIKSVIDNIMAGKTFKQLTMFIIQFGIAEMQARKFILELIEHKILIPETEPITTIDSSDYFFNNALNISRGSDLYYRINELSAILNKIQVTDLSYYNCDNKKAFSAIFGDNPKNLLQVDTKRELNEDTLNHNDVTILLREIFELIHLNNNQESTDLQVFSKKFYSRYGDQEIPLMEALDYERGIGYGVQSTFFEKDCPLLKGLTDSSKKAIPDNRMLVESVIEKYLNKIECCEQKIELNEEDFEVFRNRNESAKIRLPIGFYIMGSLLETKSIEKDFRFHLKGCGGSSGLPLLTRFAYLDDKLRMKLEKIAQAEQNQQKEAILAEIVFYPKGKAGNILSRPSLYEYEIPIIGQSAVDTEHTILVSDIFLRVEHGRVVLRSKRLNKNISPRLSSAHNFHYGMTIYRFLCDVQSQDNPLKISWNWDIDSKKPFLPRISYKHLILSRAQWNIKSKEISALNFKDNNDKIAYFVKKYQLPKRILIANGDNEVLIDLDHEIGKQIFLKELKQKDLKLIENLFDEFNSTVINSDGEAVSNETIIPVIGESPVAPRSLSIPPINKIKRKFIPGSEWLYLKIYCGEREGDTVIREEICQIVQELRALDKIQKWFFIRYTDPEPHLRVRFQLKGEYKDAFLLVTQSIKYTLVPLIENGRISKFMFDTYERELERYGPSNIENCESIFNLESETISKLLTFIKHDGEHIRWKLALKMIENMLTAFNFEISEKISFLELLRDNFLEEFRMIPKLKYKLDQNFREKKDEISGFMQSKDSDIHAILQEHLIQITDIADQCKKNADFKVRAEQIISSLVHMLLNRIFFTKQREQEMVIYHFLSKHIISNLKRMKY